MDKVLCQLRGRPDMYGLGIRVAIYTQWFGAVLMSHLDETSLPHIRVLGLLLTTAIALSLIIQAVRETLQAADIYISLLLATGIYIPLVPVYVLRGLTLCHPYCDPLCWSAEIPVPFVSIATFLLLLVVASTGFWYYITFLPGDRRHCVQYGFFFSRVSLGSDTFIALNAILCISMIILCAGVVLNIVGFRAENWRRARRRVRRARYEDLVHLALKMPLTCRRHNHKFTWKTLYTVSSVVCVAVLIAAVELTIQWNHISSVDRLDTATQIIPMLLSIKSVLSVIFSSYRFYMRDVADDSSTLPTRSSTTSVASGPSASSSSSSWPRDAPLGWTKHFTSSGNLCYVEESVKRPSRAYTA